MAPQVGTYTLADLLAIRFQSVNAFGEDTVIDVLQADIAAHNAITMEMVQLMATPTTETQDVYGTGATGEMIEVDEFGRSETQKAAVGSTVAFPLRLRQYGAGFTAKWLQVATPADVALKQLAAKKAHLKAIQRDLKRSLFGVANYTFADFLINNVALGVKRLVNADSADIPDAPDGTTFDTSTHTHYNAGATLTTTLVDEAIADLIEHGHGARVMIAVHHSNAAAFVALTGFVKAVPQYVQTPAYDVTIPSARTDLGNQYNRLLGYYGAAEVWVKPWGVANYFFTWDAAAEGKPLKFRQRDATTLQGLQLAAELPAYPLYAEYYEAEYGFGVYTRTNGVVTQFNNASYEVPAL